MSWSRSVSGTPSSVRTQLEHAVAEVEKADRVVGSSEDVVNAHRAQVTAAVDSVRALTDKLPDSVSISGSIWGQVTGTEIPIAGGIGMSITVSGTFA